MCEGAPIECGLAQYTLDRMIQSLWKLMLDVLSNKNRIMKLGFCGGLFSGVINPHPFSSYSRVFP